MPLGIPVFSYLLPLRIEHSYYHGSDAVANRNGDAPDSTYKIGNSPRMAVLVDCCVTVRSLYSGCTGPAGRSTKAYATTGILRLKCNDGSQLLGH